MIFMNTIKIIVLILLVLLITVFLGFVIGVGDMLFLYSPKPDDYNRELYTVVINNTTDKVINNLSVAYGKSIHDNMFTVSQINDLKPNQYRKVNINTKQISEEASLPYNVWVIISSDNDIIYEGAGYFALNTGGFVVIQIIDNHGEIEVQRASEHSAIYRKLYKRNIKNQNELLW